MGMLTALAARPAGAGPWSIEPVLGVETDYISNPLLRPTGAEAEEDVAAKVDLPLRYDTDELEFMLRPNGRLTNHQGYSSLASNYEHLDASAQYTDGPSSASVQSEVARDSSLYYLGGLINRIGVARDTVSTSGDWARSITELSNLELDASWMRVRYDEPADFNALVDYRYWSAGPTFTVRLSERNSIKLLGNYGLYESLNGITESKSESLQFGFVRQLTEIWTLTTSAGYSRSTNSEQVYLFGFYFLGTERSNQNGGVYSATLTRQGERFNFNIGVSRALQPTGFAFLSRQDGVNLGATYARSPRWDFALNAAWLQALNPQASAGEAEFNAQYVKVRYLNTQLIANWHWTQQWVITLTATKIDQQYGPPTVSAASTNFGLNFYRQFLRTQF
jgi:hypothetical protein